MTKGGAGMRSLACVHLPVFHPQLQSCMPALPWRPLRRLPSVIPHIYLHVGMSSKDEINMTPYIVFALVLALVLGVLCSHVSVGVSQVQNTWWTADQVVAGTHGALSI